ncbi:MAG: hypothetical protein AB7P97_21425 [Hyphomonadaceae bacterium]
MTEYKIESRFQQYCVLAQLDLDNCPTAQVIETRRAFYAGVGSVMLFLRNEVNHLSDEEIVAECNRILASIGAFWKRQAGQSSGGVTNGL